MIYQTHVQIAQIVLNQLDDFSKTYISTKEFIKGSNHPDYDLYYRFIKHQYEGSIADVRQLLIDVTTKKMSRYELGFKMGIVAHFLADNMRDSSIFGVIQRLKDKGKNVIIYELLIHDSTLEGMMILHHLEEFKRLSGVVVCNRMEDELKDIQHKVYTRDIFSSDT